MNRFYVGQSVRINCPDSDGHGQVVTILELDHFANDTYSGVYIGHMVDLEGWPEDIARGGERFCTFEPRELIPIDKPPNWRAIASHWTVSDSVRDNGLDFAEGVR